MVRFFGGRRDGEIARTVSEVRANTPLHTVLGPMSERDVAAARTRVVRDGEVDTDFIDYIAMGTRSAVFRGLEQLGPRYVRHEMDRRSRIARIDSVAGNLGAPGHFMERTGILESMGFDPPVAATLASGVDPHSKRGRRMTAEFAETPEAIVTNIRGIIDTMRQDRR